MVLALEGWALTPSKEQLERMTDYRERTDQLLAMADIRVVADVARTLASYVGHYQRRHGPISLSALLALSDSDPTAEQVEDLSEGMRCLAAALTLASALRSRRKKH
jgi:hypothetical protein